MTSLTSESSSELETENPLLRDEFRGGLHENITEVELFLENCSSLYNLILDSLHDYSAKSLTCLHLDEMSSVLAEAGRRVVQDHPDMAGTVTLRINTISSAMEQLKLRRNTTSDTESSCSRSHPSSEVRTWIHNVEKRLEEHKLLLRQRKAHKPSITKLLADQQVLQLEIQTDGQALITRLYHQITGSDSSESVDSLTQKKKKSSIDAIRKKWHTIYLNSLSLQYQIEEVLNQYQEDSECESDPELSAPPLKRKRRHGPSDDDSDVDEDTLPFADSEYESIMDGRTTVTSESSEELAVRPTKWDSVQQDIGYSSGENSIHEALNTIGENSTLVDCLRTPSKTFYRMVLDEMSDIEVQKELDKKDDVANQLTDSMHVNYEQNSVLLPEYDEVMALLEESNSLDTSVPDVMTESFNTKWREIRGRQSTRRPRVSKEFLDQLAKNSCDASSEDSLDYEMSKEDMNQMSRSFNSSILDGNGSLKRPRGNRKGSSLLFECSEMEASICSTRSDYPPCLGRSLRRKLRVRRMPRSMSDGEHVGQGMPQIRVSPPGTPISSSTRLLQRLDQDLMHTESDTAPEQSDAPAYEWDDYNPPEKDESFPDDLCSITSKMPEQILDLDEDFTNHFPILDESTRRLIDGSSAQLNIIRCALHHIDQQEIRNIEIICRQNIRNIDELLHNGKGGMELRSLRQDWSQLVRSLVNPVPHIVEKMRSFSESLRNIYSGSTIFTNQGVSQIQSQDDVRTALKDLHNIGQELDRKRVEIKNLINSDVMQSQLSEYSPLFHDISDGYDKAVNKIDLLKSSLVKVNEEWADLHKQQQNIRNLMETIDDELKTSNIDQSSVKNEMELCQERMNSLETRCNELTTLLLDIQDEDNSKKINPDFCSEFKIYATALQQLKNRFDDLTRIPTPPMQFSPVSFSTPIKRKATTTATTTTTTTQTSPVEVQPHKRTIFGRIIKVVNDSWLLKTLLGLCFTSAIAAFFWSFVLGRSFGPHMTYVNGPPPT